MKNKEISQLKQEKAALKKVAAMHEQSLSDLRNQLDAEAQNSLLRTRENDVTLFTVHNLISSKRILFF